MRKTIFNKTGYYEQLNAYEDWDLFLRLAINGHRFLVTNSIEFFYRNRTGSMIKDINSELHLQLLERIYDHLPRLPKHILMSAILSINSDRHIGIVTPIPLRYKLVDKINNQLKKSYFVVVHRLLRKILSK